MILQKINSLTKIAINTFSLHFSRKYQVTVVGAAGGVGQPLSLLLKSNPCVTKLVLHDLKKNTPGVSLDLSHIPTEPYVDGFAGEADLEKALKNANIVVICAGSSCKPGTTSDQLLDSNAPIVAEIMKKIGKICPCAFTAIMTDPINSIVPLAADALRSMNAYDQRKLFGITTLDVLRANTFYARENKMMPSCVSVPVIGGQSEETIVPLFSMASPTSALPQEKIAALVCKVKQAGAEITKAKGECTATLSMAFASNLFIKGLLDALSGAPNIQYAYVQNNDFGTCFFAGPVLIDCNGVFEMQCFHALSQSELCVLEGAIDELRKDVLKGQVKYGELKKKAGGGCASKCKK